MKKCKSLLLLLCIVLSLFSVFAVMASADTELPGDAVLEETMRFAGVEAEYSGLNGIRGVFTVNDAEIAKLEAAGCKVTYGALVGYKDSYTNLDKLDIDAKENAAKITVYENGQRKDGYFLESESGISRFAIATFFGSNAEMADAHRGMVYRGFIEIRRTGYTTERYYVDGETSALYEKASLYSVLSHAIEGEHFNKDGICTVLDRFTAVTNLYVDPQAKDGGDGLSLATAVKTVKEGYEKAVALINAGTAKDIVINLSAGKHKLADELALKGADITAAEYSITFLGSQSKEKSVISSNIDIKASDFKPVPNERYYSYKLPDSSKVDGKYPAFRDLYIDGQMATLAVSQGHFELLLDSCRNAAQNNPPLKASDRLLYVSPDALGDVEVDDRGNVIGDLEFWVQTDWQVHCVHVEHIDYNGSTGLYKDEQELIAIRIEKGDWELLLPEYYSTLKNRRYWFQNNKAYIDEKGEFWYDEANGTIYCLPYGTMKSTDTISYPLTERLFHLQGAKNITFRNLDITGTTVNYITEYGYVSGQGGCIKRDGLGFLPLGAIFADGAENIRIDSCSFYDIGGDAINFLGAIDRVRVYNSSFVNIGSCATRFAIDGAEYSTRQHYKDIIIHDNFMQNIAVTFNSSPSILVSSVENIEIMHNTILDSAYSAISIGWSWSVYGGKVNVLNAKIEYNYLENFMTKMQDGGAIYTLGGNDYETKADKAEYLNTMSHNYVVLTPETGNGRGHWTIFYHDQGSSHWLDEGNILVASPDCIGTDHTYVSFQTISPGVYNIKNDGFIFVGDWKEKKEFKVVTNNADGGVTYTDKQLTDRANIYSNLYRFESFAAMAGTPQEATVKDVAEKAGCAAYHPTYGEWSAKK